MTGPYPPEYGAGPVGPQIYAPQPYPENVAVAVPGNAAATAAVSETAVVAARRRGGDRSRGGRSTGHRNCFRARATTMASRRTALTDASAKAAIQEYLDALSKGDDQTVARHTLCGLFDAVKEHRSDLALASLSSDAFRKQYSRAEVTSIDKMVLWSPNQAQVLFTMRVAPATGSTREPAAETTRNRPSLSYWPRTTRSWCAPTCRGRPVSSDAGAAPAATPQLNESPQAQDPVAFGLSIVKPCFSMVSTKSIVAPWT